MWASRTRTDPSGADGLSASGVFAGGESALDSGVDQWGLGAVDPAGWYPFRQAVVVDPAGASRGLAKL